MRDIQRWLEKNGLGKYAELFVENDIDFDVVHQLTLDELRELGIPLGARKRILNAIAALAHDAADLRSPETAEAPKTAPGAEAEHRQLTVMFCDLVDSTALSESMDIEQYRVLLGTYQTAAKAAIEAHEGYIARYMGDGLLVYFGYPLAHENDPESAARAGLAIIDAIAELDTPIPLKVRVGVATGPVVVGDIIGEGASEEAAVLGETPNLAARLQGAAAPNTVLLSPSTHELLRGGVETATLEAVELKGLSRPIVPYRALWPRSRAEASERRQDVTSLIGRDEELGILLRRWQQAKSGEGQVVLLCAEPGVGKSRLVQSLADRVRHEVGPPVFYFCSPYYSQSALFPVIEQLQHTFGFEREDDFETKRQKLDSRLHGLNLASSDQATYLRAALSLQDTDTGQELDGQEIRRLTLDAVIGFLEAKAAQIPLLLVAEDLHWSDASTLDLLSLLVERVRSQPILAVFTYRPEFHPPWVTGPHLTTHTLNNLTTDECRRLVQEVAADHALSKKLVDEILSRCDGVPLFTEELTKTVLESESSSSSVPSAAITDIPSTLHDALIARLDRLGHTKQVAQLGAVLGRTFTRELLEAVSDLSPEQLGSSIAALLDSGLLYRRRFLDHEQIEFKHALVRDVAYASLLNDTKEFLHRRVADIIESRFPEVMTGQPELLAQHQEHGGNFNKALQSYLAAARLRNGQMNNVEALSSVESALALLPRMHEIEERESIELELALERYRAVSIINGPSSSEAGATAELATRLSRSRHDAVSLLKGLSFYANHLRVSGEYERSLNIAEEMTSVADKLSRPLSLAAAKSDAGKALYFLGQFERARPLLRESLEEKQRYASETQTSLSRVLEAGDFQVLAQAEAALGYLGQAIETTAAQMALALSSGGHRSLLIALQTEGTVRSIRREYGLTYEVGERLVSQATERRSPWHIGLGKLSVGWAVGMQGDPERGASLVLEGIQEHRAIGAKQTFDRMQSRLAILVALAGRVDEACSIIDELVPIADDPQVEFYRGEAMRVAGHGPEAETILLGALTLSQKTSARTWELETAMSLARLWSELGRNLDARNQLQSASGWFSEGAGIPLIQEARILLDKLSRRTGLGR